jgi:hypothetical protein
MRRLATVPLLVDRFGTPLHSNLRLRGLWITECYRGKGHRLYWRDESENLVVNVGLTYLIGVALLTTTQIALTSWFTGITATAPTVAAGDTMASHAGWTENTSYSQATRPAWSGVAGAAGAASNTASPSVFSANATSTAGGVFLNSVSTKSGTTGTLFSAVAFTGGDRTLLNGDTLNVTYNLSVVDDGV